MTIQEEFREWVRSLRLPDYQLDSVDIMVDAQGDAACRTSNGGYWWIGGRGVDNARQKMLTEKWVSLTRGKTI